MYNRAQPIAIQDVLRYLLSALETPACRGKIYEIGGGSVLTYAQTMSIYARLRGLRRRTITLPGLPVDLMAVVAGILTPVPTRIARPLLGGMRSNSVVRTDSARRDFPQVKPISYEASVSLALERLSPGSLVFVFVNDASSFTMRREGFFIEGQQVRLQAGANAVYRVVTGLGGRHGWLYLDWMWKLRGWFDRLIKGPGLRGRRADDDLVEGDVLDFYRVEALEKNTWVRLKSELKAPGLGWMEWRIHPQPEGDVILSQIAYFAPRGATGFLYWYLLLPVHRLVFAGLIKAIALRAAEMRDSGSK
jgi:hypothetical protein